MSQSFSRRQFLQTAGGATFLAFTPLGRAVFAADGVSPLRPAPPIFTALPYIQPGDASRLVDGQEKTVICWKTEAKEADFVVEYGLKSKLGQRAPIALAIHTVSNDDSERRFLYSAPISGLPLGKKVFYRVRCNGATVLEGFFTTRQPRGKNIRFAAFGDNSYGDISDRAIAFQAHAQNPDFVMNTGDTVYEGGLLNEYERYFFPVYNAETAGQRVGAPLLRSVPFYSVIANHDVHDKDPQKHPVANFDVNPDSLAYYMAWHYPLNGPMPTNPTPTIGDAATIAAFQKVAAARFPRTANYSYDVGDAHFLCLDSNLYVDPTDAALQNWIEKDLTSTDALWKFVTFHHPCFNVGEEHFNNQHMRALSPIFEKCGVDFALHGHEHTYQRPRPLRFAPRDLSGARKVGVKDRYVPGDFHIDRRFDGIKNTRADGIIYVTTGAGGKHLYDQNWTTHPEKWTHAEDNNVSYVEKFVSDRHSLTMFDLDGGRLTMRQIDEWGHEIDRIVVTKA